MLVSPKVEKARIDKSRSDRVKTTPVGKDATLNCVYTGNPPPKVHWTKDGKKLDTNCKYCVQKVENMDGVSTLRVTPYRDIDFGDYKCRARNRLGFGDITIKLQEDKTKSRFCVKQRLKRNRFQACIFFLIPIISAKEYNVFNSSLKNGPLPFLKGKPLETRSDGRRVRAWRAREAPASKLALHTHHAPSLQYGRAPLKQKLKKMTPVLQARLLLLILFSIVSHKSEKSPLMMRGRVHAVRHTVACLAGVFPPFLLAHPSRFSRAQNPLSLHFQTPATQTTGRHTEKFYFPFPLPPTFGKDLLKRLPVSGMTDLFHSNRGGKIHPYEQNY